MKHDSQLRLISSYMLAVGLPAMVVLAYDYGDRLLPSAPPAPVGIMDVAVFLMVVAGWAGLVMTLVKDHWDDR